MLSQLEQLSITAEGRYATPQELQPLKNYFPTVSVRLSAYQKIHECEAEIMEQLRLKMIEKQPHLTQLSSVNVKTLCGRDIKIVLRIAAAAMLIDDLNRVRENILLWQRTITKAFKIEDITALAYSTMPEIVEQFLTPEEFTLIKPILMLNQAVLAD